MKLNSASILALTTLTACSDVDGSVCNKDRAVLAEMSSRLDKTNDEIEAIVNASDAQIFPEDHSIISNVDNGDLHLSEGLLSDPLAERSPMRMANGKIVQCKRDFMGDEAPPLPDHTQVCSIADVVKVSGDAIFVTNLNFNNCGLEGYKPSFVDVEPASKIDGYCSTERALVAGNSEACSVIIDEIRTEICNPAACQELIYPNFQTVQDFFDDLGE